MAEIKDDLLQQFLTEYEKTRADPAGGPDPGLVDLIDAEDELAQVIAGLDLLELADAERGDLLGKRMPDMPDVMFETGEALRECEEILTEIKTDPALFEQVATQDMALGGLIQALQWLYNGADTGLLLRGMDANRILDDADDKVDTARKDPGVDPTRQEVIESQFAGPQTRRQKGEQRAKDATDAMKAALQPHEGQVDEARQQKELGQLVHDLMSEALAEQQKGPKAAKNPKTPKNPKNPQQAGGAGTPKGQKGGGA